MKINPGQMRTSEPFSKARDVDSALLQNSYKKVIVKFGRLFFTKRTRSTNQSIQAYVPFERNRKNITGGGKIFNDSLRGFIKGSPGPVEPKSTSTCPILFSV